MGIWNHIWEAIVNKDRVDYIKSSSILDPLSDCWVWLKYCNPFGYGVLSYGGKKILAHRHSWEAFNGEIQNDLWVLHKCDNPYCVNPDHLFLGNHQDNTDDMMKKGRHVPQTSQPKMRGEDNPHSKLTLEEVNDIKRKYIPYKYSYSKLGKEYDVSESTIREIIYGNNWSYI